MRKILVIDDDLMVLQTMQAVLTDMGYGCMVAGDYRKALELLKKYRHNLTGEDNGDSHIKRQLFGREVVVAVTRGKLDFGPWEQIFYGEFDGKRRKRVLVKIIGE